MPLQPGTKLGSYEILSPIGDGTGIEVYKATDTEASRTVAIQVIPPQWADGSEFPARKELFDRATQAVASLNHPHIRALHDVGQHDGVDFLVLEYLEGQTLAERLKGKALNLGDALAVAIALADALDKAHGAGVVHRGLNPASVMLTKTGAKLLDFGWAELRPAPAASAVPKSASVTAAEAARKPDDSLTLQYTAPEQFEGKPAGARADIFAFGAILYEMVTGKKAFEGKSRGVVIAAIVTAEPDRLTLLQPKAPRVLEHVVERCLAKDPDDRWQTVHDLLVQLRWIAEGGAAGGLFLPASRTQRLVRAALLAGALLVAALAYPAVRYLRGPGELEAIQFRIPIAGLSDSDIALAPDGETIALVARPNSSEAAALFVRRMGSVAFVKLGGTEDAVQPFWSPDSRSVAFVVGTRLKSVSVAGGAPKDICEAQKFYGGAWNREGTILFGSARGLFRVSAEGGKPSAVTTPEAQETGHYWPSFLPDGRGYLYLAWSAQTGNRAVFVGSLDSKEKTRLMAADSNAVYAAPGYVLFHREASLFAQPFDSRKRSLTGEPVHVADEVASSASTGRGDFDVSQNGSLLYFQGVNATAGRGRALSTQFGWVDRSGTRGQIAGEGGNYGDMDLSPDGKLIAVTRQDSNASGADIWVIDWQRAGVATRLTLDPADDVDPVWSPDGTRVAFTTFRKGNADIYVKNANNVGAETPLLESASDEIVKDWSKDGRFIAYLSGQEGAPDIYVLPLSEGKKPGAEKPFPVVQGKFQKNEPQFSYDGKWLAYTSDETGTFQVTVISFPAGDQKLQVSRAGGGQPRWRKDGKELFYRAPDGDVMAVDIKTVPKLEASVPHTLFRSPSTVGSAVDPVRHQLAVMPDGQRFLLRFSAAGIGGGGGPNSAVPEAQPFASGFGGGGGGRAGINNGPGGGMITTGLTVIQHWPAALGKGKK